MASNIVNNLALQIVMEPRVAVVHVVKHLGAADAVNKGNHLSNAGCLNAITLGIVDDSFGASSISLQKLALSIGVSDDVETFSSFNEHSMSIKCKSHYLFFIIVFVYLFD